MGSYQGPLSTIRDCRNTKLPNSEKTRKKKSSKRKLSKDMIRLWIHNKHVEVGDTITGTIEIKEDAPTSFVKLVFEGIEYTVVTLAQTRDNHMGLEYLEKHTSERNVLTSQQVLVDVSATLERKQIFRFIIPKGLPGTMRCVLDGSDPILPSQYNTTYTITASIFKNTSKAKVTQSIIVSPRSCQDVPLDSATISVSVVSPLKSIASTLFQCGSVDTTFHESGTDKDASKGNGLIEEGEEEVVFLDKRSQLFSLKCQQPMHESCFAVGQIISVNVADWLGRQLSGTWMVQLIEEIGWSAKGRRTSSISKWNLFANHHELPSTLQRSFAGENSRLSVKHHLVVFLATDEEDPSKEVMACSEPFPIMIVSNTRGWDA